MSLILMTTLVYKEMILQRKIWWWSLLRPNGLMSKSPGDSSFRVTALACSTFLCLCLCICMFHISVSVSVHLHVPHFCVLCLCICMFHISVFCVCVFLFGPRSSQFLPPQHGKGLVQVLDRVWYPPPHCEYPPSTAKEKYTFDQHMIKFSLFIILTVEAVMVDTELSKTFPDCHCQNQ